MIFFIPGQLLSLLTFPGVIMHEISHRFMCDIFEVPVYRAFYFIPFSKQAGAVFHERVYNFGQHLVIAMAPLLFNTLFCMLFTLPLAASQYIMSNSFAEVGTSVSHYGTLYSILWWVGISMGANAFPSNHDIEQVRNVAPQSMSIGLLTSIVQFLNFLRVVWISFLYAYGVSLVLPALIFG